MSLFDLLFIVVFLGTVIALVPTLVLLARKQRDRAAVWLRRVVVADLTYFAAIVVTSVATPQRVVAVGEAQCFDDWCITVTGSQRIVGAGNDSMRVAITLSSQARGIAQGERDVAVQLMDGTGHSYLPVVRPTDLPLSMTLPPSGSEAVSRVVVVPTAARDLMVVVVHDRFPHCCIIGDRESLLHKVAVVRL